MSDDRIKIAQIDFLHHHVKTMLLGVIMTSLVVTAVFYNSADNRVLFLWLGSIFLLTLVRYYAVRRYHSRQRSDQDILRWGRLFVFFMFLSGCTWGAASLLFFNPHNPGEVLILTMVLTGILVGSLASMSAVLSAYYSFAIATGLPLVYVFVTAGTSEFFLFGLLAGVFVLVQLSLSRVTNRMLNESVALRFTNLDLIEQLKEEKRISLEAQNQAERANASKTKFLAAASHDLRQPLHAQNLFLGLLEDKLEDDEHKSIVTRIQKSNQALSDLLEDLLDISKLDANIIEVCPQPVSLKQIFADLKNEFDELAREKGLYIHFVSSRLWVTSDRNILMRILRNLISNAIRYTEKGGVLVGLRRRAGKVAICVYDTGVGIPEDKQEEIFHEFLQLQNHERDRTRGFGLGLAIVRRLARLLAADLKLESVSGKGSVFCLQLEACDTRNSDKTVEASRPGESVHSGKTILVVDDEVDILSGLTALLENRGYFVISAVSGDDALEKLSSVEAAPDLIISDYRLRENETGTDVVEKVQCQYEHPIPVIIITGDTDPERIKKARISGYSLLHKPISAQKLLGLIVATLDKGG